MTDKQLKRATQIKRDLENLIWVKRQFEKETFVQFNMKPIEMIKNDLIDVVEGQIAKLKEEYKSL